MAGGRLFTSLRLEYILKAKFCFTMFLTARDKPTPFPPDYSDTLYHMSCRLPGSSSITVGIPGTLCHAIWQIGMSRTDRSDEIWMRAVNCSRDITWVWRHTWLILKSPRLCEKWVRFWWPLTDKLKDISWSLLYKWFRINYCGKQYSLVKIWMYRELNGIERLTCQLFTLCYDDKHTKRLGPWVKR